MEKCCKVFGKGGRLHDREALKLIAFCKENVGHPRRRTIILTISVLHFSNSAIQNRRLVYDLRVSPDFVVVQKLQRGITPSRLQRSEVERRRASWRSLLCPATTRTAWAEHQPPTSSPPLYWTCSSNYHSQIFLTGYRGYKPSGILPVIFLSLNKFYINTYS